LFFPSVRSKILPVHKTYGRARPKVKPLRCPPLQQGRLWEEPTEEIGPTSDSVGILAVCGGEDVNNRRDCTTPSGPTKVIVDFHNGGLLKAASFIFASAAVQVWNERN
jgi:hypothetical protein